MRRGQTLATTELSAISPRIVAAIAVHRGSFDAPRAAAPSACMLSPERPTGTQRIPIDRRSVRARARRAALPSVPRPPRSIASRPLSPSATRAGSACTDQRDMDRSTRIDDAREAR